MIVYIENGKVINKIENLLSDGMYVFVYENKVSIINFDCEREHYQCIALGSNNNLCYHSRRNNFADFIFTLNPYSIYYFETLEEFAKTVLEKKWVFENYL